MHSRHFYVRFFAILGMAAPAVVSPLTGCSVRVGQGDANAGSSDTDDPSSLPSACARIGDEKKLAVGAGAQAFAFVWDTDHYVLVYSDPSMGAGDIYVSRMAIDGTPMGGPVAVAATPAKSDLPNLIRTQSGYVVVWQEGTAGQAVVAHALGPDGAPVGDLKALAATQSNQSRPVVSHAPGGQLAVTWMDSINGKSGVQVALADASLAHVVGPQRIAATDVDGWPWVAGDDQKLALVWSDKTAGPYDVRFAAVDTSTLAANAPTSLRGVAARDGLLPRMVRTKSGFIAAWEDMRGSDNEIYMALVDDAGNRLGGGLVEEPNTGDANWPNIAWAGADAAIVYYQWRGSRPQVFMSFIDATGMRVAGLHDLQVSRGSDGWSKYPDIAWTGQEFGVIYVDDRDGKPSLWLQRVSCHT
jgi:hypothetical protein